MIPRKPPLSETTARRQSQNRPYDQRHADAAMFRSVSMSAATTSSPPPSLRIGHGPGAIPGHELKRDGGNYHNTDSIKRPFQFLDVSSPTMSTGHGNNTSSPMVGRTHSMPVELSDATNGASNNRGSGRSGSAQENGTAAVWNVTGLRVPPIYYPLERTAVIIEPPTTLHDIVSTITNYLRDNSISVVYHHDDSGRADCMTPNLLKFTIQLWESLPPPPLTTMTTSSSKRQGVIVEVQRRNGCCIEMQHVRQQLIQLLMSPEPTIAEDRADDYNIQPSMFGSTTMDRQVHDGFHAILQSTIEPYVKKPLGDEGDALQISLSLLRSPHFSQNRLGLESLVQLTDPCCVKKSVARLTSERILKDPNLHGLLQQYFVGTELSSSNINGHGQYRRSRLSEYEEDDDENMGPVDYEKGTAFGAMHVLGLKVLSRALDTWKLFSDDKTTNTSLRAKNGSNHSPQPLSTSSLDISSKFWDDVCSSCLYDIEASSHRPLEASLSVHSLRLLMSLTPEPHFKSLLHQGCRSTPMSRMLSDARNYGRQCHRDLERETEIFMNQLGQDVH